MAENKNGCPAAPEAMLSKLKPANRGVASKALRKRLYQNDVAIGGANQVGRQALIEFMAPR